MTSIGIDEVYSKMLEELVKLHEFNSKKEFAESMIAYFKDSGINPRSKNKSTADELAKLRNTMISFIKEQEKKKLDPMILKVSEIMEYMKEYFTNDALTKADLEKLLKMGILPNQQINNTEEKNTIAKDNRVYTDEHYQNLISHVKGLFNDFQRNFKSSAFGGFTVDKNVVEKYKGLFEKLQV
jgi:hypothetical protein